MLTEKELCGIEKHFEENNELTNEQVIALDDHINGITRVREDYVGELPMDVFEAQEADLKRIVALLSTYLRGKNIYNFG